MKKHIICYGDSNTYGYIAGNNSRYSEEERWTCLLQKSLGEEYYILEEGLCGRTTVFDDPIHEGLCGLEHLYPCLMSHKPIDLLIIMLGTNDTKERFGSSAACSALGLQRLVMKAISTDCWKIKPNILIIAPKAIEKEYELSEVAGTMGKGCAEKSKEMALEYKKIAEVLNCHYLDANQLEHSNKYGYHALENNKIDFMHLTAESHCRLAKILSDIIPEIVDK